MATAFLILEEKRDVFAFYIDCKPPLSIDLFLFFLKKHLTNVDRGAIFGADVSQEWI